MASVFVLYHADIEDDRYIRGIFATEALAEAALRWDEVHEGRNLRGISYLRRNHHEDCCSVDEVEVRTELPDVLYGPPARYAEAPGPGLIPKAVEGALRRSFIATSPVYDYVMQTGKRND